LFDGSFLSLALSLNRDELSESNAKRGKASNLMGFTRLFNKWGFLDRAGDVLFYVAKTVIIPIYQETPIKGALGSYKSGRDYLDLPSYVM
jgi:hypothetical protein